VGFSMIASPSDLGSGGPLPEHAMGGTMREYFLGWGGVGPAVFLPLLGFALFFLELLAIVLPEAGMFLRKYGRRHRLTGSHPTKT